jgi:acyl dehydratase
MNTYESLEVGQSYTFERVITAEEVQMYAKLTGDDNPIHIDEEFAKGTRFGKRIVHGAFLLGVISKVLGRDFPGHGSVAVSFAVKFVRPVPVGSTISVEVKIAEKFERHKHVRAKVYVYTNGKTAVGGEATFIPPTEEGPSF